MFRGKGLGKEENGRVKPVQVEQKQNVKGIGYGTEGVFAPWWDDLYNKTAVKTQIKPKKEKKMRLERIEKKERKDKKEKKEKKEKKKRTERIEKKERKEKKRK